MTENRYIDLLKNRGFFCFFWTQFLGAFNDNFYKIIVTLVALDIPAAMGGGAEYIPLIGGLFILPFLLFSGYAGYLADIHSKRNILVAVKVFEIIAMGMGFLAFFVDRIEPMLAVVFLMGLHSTFFSPSKSGILPEMLPERELARGNGLLEMSTFLAIILGTSLGGAIYEAWKDRLGWIGVVLIAIAALGTLTSLGITKVPPSGAIKKFVINPFAELWSGTKELYTDRPLWLTVMGISYFWFLGALLQMVLPLFGKEVLQLRETEIGLLWTFAAIGIGIGSLAAGRLSGAKIELGLVPLGAVGMGLFSVALFLAQHAFSLSASSLVFLGFSGGLFAVPLNALLQQRSGREDKGRLIATNNVFNTLGVLLASILLWALSSLFHFSADSGSGLPDARGNCLRALSSAGFFHSFYSLAPHPHGLSDPHHRSGKYSPQRCGAVGFKPRLVCRCAAHRGHHATLHTLLAPSRLLRPPLAQLVFPPDESDSGLGDESPRDRPIVERGARGVGERPGRVHFCRGRHQSNRALAAVQARR